MTLTTTAASVTAIGNNATTLWPFTFIIPTEDDVEVSITLLSDGTTTVLTNGVDYEGVGEHPYGQPDGGFILYPIAGSPLGTGNSITISRIVPITQETDLDNQGTLYPEVIEDEFDYLTMIDQQLQSQLNRAFLAPPGEEFPDGSWAAWLAIMDGGTVDVQAAENLYESAAVAAATEIPVVQFIETFGGNDVGDGGGQQYWRSAVSLGTYNEFESADGAWWEPNTGNANQAFWSNAGSNPTRDQPVYVTNSRNRFFLGAASGAGPTRTGFGEGGWGWMTSNDIGPAYLARDAAILYMNEVDCVGICSMIWQQQTNDPPTFSDAIALGLYARGERANTSVWTNYWETQYMGSAVSAAVTLEADVRNAGDNVTCQPYQAANTGALGLAMAGGGDTVYGPTTLHPSVFAYSIGVNGQSYGFGGFNTGIIFRAKGVEGTDGTNAATGDGPANAIQFARGHEIQWYDQSTRKSFYIRGAQLSTDAAVGMTISSGNVSFRGANGVASLTIAQSGTLVNGLSITGVATTTPLLSAAGTDTDINIGLVPKGGGDVRTGAPLWILDTTAVPVGGTADIGLRMSNTLHLGVFFGSGAPTLSAAKGSLYLRTDGTTTNDRLYVCTGTTNWTAVTTAA